MLKPIQSSIFAVIIVLLALNKCCGFDFANQSPGGEAELGPDYDADGDNSNSNTNVGWVIPAQAPKGRQRLINQLNEQRGYPRLDNRQRFDEIARPKARCDRRIRVINGATRIRDKGALVRFQCSYGFHMLGVALAVCLKGKWSDPPPICVRDGCRTLPIPVQGNLRLLYGGGVAMFTCNYGHYLEGERVLTCDGTRWNGTAPECIEIPPVTLSPPSTTFPTIPLEMASPDPEPEAENKTASVLLPDQSSSTNTDSQSSTFEPDSDTTMKSTSTQVESGIRVPTSTMANEHEVETATDSSSGTPLLEPDRNIGTEHTETLPEILATTGKYIPVPSTTEQISTTEMLTSTTATTPIVITEDVPVQIPTTQKWLSLDAITESATVPEILISTPTSTISTTTIVATTPPTSASTTPLTTTTVPASPSTSTLPTTPMLAPETTVQGTLSTSTTYRPFVPKLPKKPTQLPTRNPKTYTYPKKQSETREQSSRNLDIENETRKELISIAPSKLDDGHHINPEHYNFAHLLIIVGTVLVTIGSVSILGAVLMHCWRKNKGIARARSHDLDGRTLSYNEGNDEVVWLDSRDHGGL